MDRTSRYDSRNFRSTFRGILKHRRNEGKILAECRKLDPDLLAMFNACLALAHPMWLQIHGGILRRIFHAFDQTYHMGYLPQFITRDEGKLPSLTSQFLHDCLGIVHQDLERCEDPGCQWLSHRCDGCYDCPLLPVDLSDPTYHIREHISPGVRPHLFEEHWRSSPRHTGILARIFSVGWRRLLRPSMVPAAQEEEESRAA